MSDKSLYPTFARTFPPATQVTTAILSLLNHFAWRRFTLVVGSTERWESIASNLQLKADLFNLTINGRFDFGEPYYRELDEGNSIETIVEQSYIDTRGETDRRKDERTEGRTNGRKDGRTNGRTDGQTDGRTDGGTDGRTKGRSDGRRDRRTEGRTDRRTDGRTDGRKDGRTNGRTDGGTIGRWTDGGTDGRTNEGTDDGMVSGVGQNSPG